MTQPFSTTPWRNPWHALAASHTATEPPAFTRGSASELFGFSDDSDDSNQPLGLYEALPFFAKTVGQKLAAIALAFDALK